MKFKQMYEPKHCLAANGKFRKMEIIVGGDKMEVVVPKNFKDYSAVAVDWDGEVTLFESCPRIGAETWYNEPTTGWITLGRIENDDGSFADFEDFMMMNAIPEKRINFDNLS